MSLNPLVRHSLGLSIMALALFEPMFREGQPSITAFAESGRPETSAAGIPLPAPGESTVRELTAGETNTYVISLSRGQYVSFVIERRDLDISLALYDPAGSALLQVDCRQLNL